MQGLNTVLRSYDEMYEAMFTNLDEVRAFPAWLARLPGLLSEVSR